MSEISLSGLEFEVYVHVACLSVMIWDVLHNLKADYHLLFWREINSLTILYFISRIMTLGYAFSKTAFLTKAMFDCTVLGALISTFYMLSVTFTLCLSYMKLAPLLETRRRIQLVFSLLLLLAIGGNLTFAIGVSGKEPTHTPGLCAVHISGQYVSSAFGTLLIYHSIVCLAIVYSTYSNSTADEDAVCIQERYDRMMGSTPSPSRRSEQLTLKDQISYIIPVILSLASLLFFLVPASDPNSSLRLMMVVVYCVCVNILVCRSYRDSRFMVQLPKSTKSMFPGLKLDLSYARSGQPSPFAPDFNNSDDGHEGHYTTSELDGPGGRTMMTSPVMEIAVQKIVEYKRDVEYCGRGDENGSRYHSGSSNGRRRE